MLKNMFKKILYIIIATIFIWLGLFAQTSAADVSWNEVKNFTYQLQNVSIDDLAKSNFNLAVIDYSKDGSEVQKFSAEEISKIKNGAGGGSKKKVLSYLSIGEAEDYRYYWQSDWQVGNPSFIDAENPDWPGNYKVKYWQSEWQNIILAYEDKIIEQGFDGVYLDLIDAYEYYEPGGESGLNRAEAKQEMVDFVKKIATHARLEKGKSDFAIFVQNASELGANSDYLAVVTGIGQEDYSYGNPSDGAETPQDEHQTLTTNLTIFKNASKIVLIIDYPFDNPDRPNFTEAIGAKIDKAYSQAETQGFIDYCTVRNLNYLTINPGHEPKPITISSDSGQKTSNNVGTDNQTTVSVSRLISTGISIVAFIILLILSLVVFLFWQKKIKKGE